MKFLFFMLLFLLAVMSRADSQPDAPPPGIFRIDDNSGHSACTAVAVSPDGMLLTALHCLRNCLRHQGRMESTSNPFIGLTELDVVIDPQTAVSCPNLSIQSLGTEGVMVLAAGASLIRYDSHFFLSDTADFSATHAKGLDVMNDDFALIQIAEATPDCGQLSRVDILPNAHLSALGFQQQDDEPAVLAYDETPGFRYSSSSQSAYAQLTVMTDFSKYVSQLFDHTEIIYSSAAVKEGQSGGPVINDQREIAGLVSGHTTDGQGVSELFAVPLSHIMDKLPVSLAQNLRLKNAACHSSF